MGRDVANESASEFSRWNARSRLFGRLRGLHGLCLTPRRPARPCPELSFRMLFSCADTQSRSTCLSARSRTTPPPLCRGPVPSFMWSELRHALVPINGPRERSRHLFRARSLRADIGLRLARPTFTTAGPSFLCVIPLFVQIAPFSSTGEGWSQDLSEGDGMQLLTAPEGGLN
jgi:hypothetical protein